MDNAELTDFCARRRWLVSAPPGFFTFRFLTVWFLHRFHMSRSSTALEVGAGAPRGEAQSGRMLLSAFMSHLECMGCGTWDTHLCPPCAANISQVPRQMTVAVDGGQLPVWFTVTYDDVVPGIISAAKEMGSSWAVRILAPWLQASVMLALSGQSPALLVAPPSSRSAWRARGFSPLRAISNRAGLRLTQGFYATRTRADQSSLTQEQRAQNLVGSLAARDGLHGRRVLIIDDILTTGATLRECARALTAGGAQVAGAAVIAYTPRIYPRASSLLQMNS